MAGHREVSNIDLRLMYDAMSAAGLAPERTWGFAGIEPRLVHDPSALVPVRVERAAQSVVATMHADARNLFADLGSRFNAALFDVAGLALSTVPTIRRWLGFLLVTDFHFSVAEFVAIEIDPHTTALELRVPMHVGRDLARLTIERDVAAILPFLDDLWQGEFPLRALELGTADVPDLIRARARCRVSAGHAVTRLVWDNSVNEHPLPRACEHAFVHYAKRSQVLHPVAEWNPTSAGVVQQVEDLLNQPGNARLSLDEVARQLWMAPRTVQRHLAERTVSFRRLRETALAREARRLLVETELPISNIAGLLGYAEISSMSAAFRRWEKQSPSVYRRVERRRGAAS